MWILKAIFQAIAQAVTFILPVSESGHSAVFHNFAERYTNACSQLTGIIHIGIAIGLFLAFFKLFKNLFFNFISTWIEIFQKNLNIKNAKPSRSFMYMTMLSFVPMILYAIPAGKYKNIYNVFHRVSYNESIFGEGICLILTGVLLFATIGLAEKKLNPLPKTVQAIILGIIAFLAVPTSGCSLIAGVFCVGVIVGMNEKLALRYSVVLSTMVLLVSGIVELCIGVTKINIISALIGLIVSAVVSFFVAKLLVFIIKKKQLMPFAVYDIAFGLIALIIGIFQIVVK